MKGLGLKHDNILVWIRDKNTYFHIFFIVFSSGTQIILWQLYRILDRQGFTNT